MTAHASQGMITDAAIVDLRVGKEASPLHGYVALSRVKRKENIFVFRPFDIKNLPAPTMSIKRGTTPMHLPANGKIKRGTTPMHLPANDNLGTTVGGEEKEIGKRGNNN